MRKEVFGDATLYLGDCLEVLPAIGTANLIVTDPPYGIDIRKGFNGDDKSICGDDGFSVMFFIDRHIREWDRLLPVGGAIYVFTRFDVMPYWWLRLKGWFDMKNCIVWSKGGGGTGDLSGNYIGTHEMILFGAKGRHLLRGKRESNVWQYGKQKPDAHPMQKPTDLIENILLHSSDEGQVVLDPFMGSGTTGVACLHLGRGFIGIETDPKHFDIACRRIENAERQERLIA